MRKEAKSRDFAPQIGVWRIKRQNLFSPEVEDREITFGWLRSVATVLFQRRFGL